ncbi:MAG: DUF1579 domain-containing protein [Phycisphaerales bacterium]
MSSKSPTADQMAACAEMFKPAPEHAVFKPFAGTFRSEVKMWMMPASEPQVSTGTMVNTLVLNDRYLEQSYQDDSGMFAGRGFLGYNTVDKRYEGFWIDSIASFFQVEHGQYDKATKTWEMHSTLTDPSSGKPMRKRSVMRAVDNDHLVMEMYFSHTENGKPGPEFKCMEIRHTRK